MFCCYINVHQTQHFTSPIHKCGSFYLGSRKDENIHRLEGSSGGPGGLMIRKKPSDAEGNSEPNFRSPRPSKLGLDQLASQKTIQRVRSALFIVS